jgi:predicted N-acetyltransferase YhbS
MSQIGRARRDELKALREIERDAGRAFAMISVATEHARRGLGASLIERLEADAAAKHRRALTLTTFRDVPWNAQYYARLGFVVLEAGEYGPELRALIERERNSIPSDMVRVAMRRPTVTGV